MTWTTPQTAVDGDLITAAFWNTNGRDNLVYLHDYSVRKLRMGGDDHIEGGWHDFGVLGPVGVGSYSQTFAEAFSTPPYGWITCTHAKDHASGAEVGYRQQCAFVGATTTGVTLYIRSYIGAQTDENQANWLAFGEG